MAEAGRDRRARFEYKVFAHEGAPTIYRRVMKWCGWALGLHVVDTSPSDMTVWHDHAHDLYSVVLWGFATEVTCEADGRRRAHWLFPFRVRIRAATVNHTFTNGGRMVTLILTSPRKRENKIYIGSPDSDEVLTTRQVQVQ